MYPCNAILTRPLLRFRVSLIHPKRVLFVFTDSRNSVLPGTAISTAISIRDEHLGIDSRKVAPVAEEADRRTEDIAAAHHNRAPHTAVAEEDLEDRPIVPAAGHIQIQAREAVAGCTHIEVQGVAADRSMTEAQADCTRPG